jgi:hypothetical protein
MVKAPGTAPPEVLRVVTQTVLTRLWTVLVPLAFVTTSGCVDDNAVVVADTDANGAQLDASAPEVLKAFVIVQFPATELRQSFHDHRGVGSVEIWIEESSRPGSALLAQRLAGDPLAQFDNCGDAASESSDGPLKASWHANWDIPLLEGEDCCGDFGVDASGLGYAFSDAVWEWRCLTATGTLPVPGLKKHEVAKKTLNISIQAYDCEGLPFRPRRFCGIKFGGLGYDVDPLSLMEGYVFAPYSAVISHSIALPFRHAKLGTFPACPDEVTETCGDGDCVWPEDEVNCFRDCHWVAWPPPDK